jgi:DNA polymerase I-like protein with 3'-5' exonuclease and polymerase domains
MFFEDEPLVLKKRAALRALPPIPDTDWKPPQYFPNLSSASTISLDVETEETDFEYGPGWGRGKGQIIGFSVGAKDSKGNHGTWYFPVRHKVEPEWNLDPKPCFAWLKTIAETSIPKVGANLIYDIGWLTTENIHVAGRLYDVQFAEALIDEQGEVNLDHLARKYLKASKTSEALYEWLARAYGGKPGSDQRMNLWRAPPRLAGPYGEQDAALPLQIIDRQWPILENEGLTELFRMECRLIPLLVQMRLSGVTIDLKAVQKLYDSLGIEIDQLNAKLCTDYGLNVNVKSPKDVKRLFAHIGIDDPGNFQKETLKGLSHNVGNEIIRIRELEKLRGTFLKSYILDRAQPIAGSPDFGRLYCSFHPLKGDENGTKTGRFASSDPNLQNVSVRSKEGKQVRKAFVHDIGHARFRKIDYSQIEYRALAHFATSFDRNALKRQSELDAADALRQTYINDPKTDYHNRVYEMVCPLMGWDFNDSDKELRAARRKPIKNVNFGLLYGESEKHLAFKAGFTPQQAKDFFKAYHAAAPYARSTMRAISEEVQTYGYITTIRGRRCRFNLWEPADQYGAYPVPYEQALSFWGNNIKRAGEYRGTNYKFQGSAADIIKFAMVKCFDDGIFDVTGVPKLQVHDELCFSEIDDSHEQKEAYKYMKWVLENTTECRVPIIAEVGTGPNWAEADG